MATNAPTDAPASEQGERRRPLLPPFIIEDGPAPLYISSPEGAVRVRGTRIPLETVIWEYEQGRTPEEIVDSFDTLELADVYGVIAYYLRHRAAVSAYVQQIEALEEAIIREIQAQPGYAERQKRLKARWAAMQQQTNDASASG